MSEPGAAQTARHDPVDGPPRNDRREVFGWMMYDWANSAFSTTVVTALFGPYITALARAAVGENGVVLQLGPLAVTTKSLYPYCVAASILLQALLLPVLGALADYTSIKKRLMAALCYLGVAATSGLFFITGELYLLGGLLFIIANLCFGGAIVLYNAFLCDITTEDQRDKVSSRGFAMGYLGGGLLLAANLGLVQFAETLGITTGLAVRLSLLSAGLWWGGFALIAFARLKTRAVARSLPPGQGYLTVGFVELRSTFRELRRLPQTARYLVSFIFYNDGISTVIALSSTFLAHELFVARGLPEDPQFLILLILMVQFVAFAGALLFERVAALINTKNAILLSLVIWSGVVIYAYGLLQTVGQAWVMGVVIALVLGGSQALSRALFSRMIPAGREGAFFGIYEISDRGTSWIGQIIFGTVAAYTGSYRQAILSLIVLFITGMVILFTTNADRAIRDAGNQLPSDAAEAKPVPA